MIGVILAAGIGSRLRPMTNDKPKCLVSVAGKAMLSYQIDAYRTAGISDVYIVVGYEASKIRTWCKYITGVNIHIIENTIYEETNNMYSLYLVKKFIAGRAFILNNADLVVDVNLVSKMIASPESDIIAIDRQCYNDESMKVSCNSVGYIDNITKIMKREESVGCSLDFYKFSADSSRIFFDEIDYIINYEGNKKDWTEVAMQKLFKRQGMKFKAWDVGNMPWVEIDNYSDLAKADEIFSQKNKKIKDYKCYCFDLDGTVYVGRKVLKNVVLSIKKIKEQGGKVIFLSNNSSYKKSDYVHRLNVMDIDCTSDDIRLSTDGVVSFLNSINVQCIYVLGTKALQEDFISAGFILSETEPEIIVVGYDMELTYHKLVTACRLINNGIDYIATHQDLFCPSEFGPIPDIGGIIKLIEVTTNINPLRVFGKPDKAIIDNIIDELDVSREDILIIGDRLYTDIKMANDACVDSVLVLSGDTQRDELEGHSIKPTYIMPEFVL